MRTWHFVTSSEEISLILHFNVKPWKKVLVTEMTRIWLACDFSPTWFIFHLAFAAWSRQWIIFRIGLFSYSSEWKRGDKPLRPVIASETLPIAGWRHCYPGNSCRHTDTDNKPSNLHRQWGGFLNSSTNYKSDCQASACNFCSFLLTVELQLLFSMFVFSADQI